MAGRRNKASDRARAAPQRPPAHAQTQTRTRTRTQTRAGAIGGRNVGLLLAFCLVAFVLYAPALDGPFVSDDAHYVVHNPYVSDLTPGRALELFDPRGEAVRLVENYAPVHVLLHALQWKLFGPDVRGHHVVNVMLHVVVSLLLVVGLRRAGLAAPLAAFGGAFFLVHPANVEAVAWISQLKTTASLALAIGALLLRPRRPGLALLVFTLGLLAKPMAALALPVAVVQVAVARRRDEDGAERPRLVREAGWLGGWIVVFAAFAVAELAAFLWASAPLQAEAGDWGGRAQMAASLVARYAWMALTGLGVSFFHSPARPATWLDPLVLAGLAITALVAARAVFAFRARRTEAAWWVWAGAAFVPVSQFLAFRHPLADHYLYPILPGLIGGLLLALSESRAAGVWLAAKRARISAAVLAVAVLVALGVHAYERARLWSSPALLLADSAANYPDGIQAHLQRVRRAANAGQPEQIATELRGALALGFDRFEQILADPATSAYGAHPDVQAVLRDMAARWVERYAGHDDLSQAEWLSLGFAHQVRDERDAARRAFERALARGGPLDDNVRTALRELGDGPGSPGEPGP
ncbi:hypothetical protein KJ059_14435 [Myxococcota bacterium]|nr:hypothetical protein [Myxococcota bacterium]MCZ7617934.1 hypothetical protein [Myxococcota bacterium]